MIAIRIDSVLSTSAIKPSKMLQLLVKIVNDRIQEILDVSENYSLVINQAWFSNVKKSIWYLM